MSKLDEAIAFAATAHAGQLRKYSGLPYIIHPIEVMTIAAEGGGLMDDMEALMGAVLHDVVEDTVVGLAEIERRFGLRVRTIVDYLTDVPASYGNRAARKAANRDRLLGAPTVVQTIKLADLISNTRSIVEHDPKFARVYLAEKQAMLLVLSNGARPLREQAQRQLVAGQERLVQLHLGEQP